jgi:hypothetical protein
MQSRVRVEVDTLTVEELERLKDPLCAQPRWHWTIATSRVACGTTTLTIRLRGAADRGEAAGTCKRRGRPHQRQPITSTLPGEAIGRVTVT